MAPPAGYEKPPQFEISDLKLQMSDPIWPDAVRLVQTYWKQATVLDPKQRRQYLQFLNDEDLASKIVAVKQKQCLVHGLSYDKKGKRVLDELYWVGFLMNATLLDALPLDYAKTIRKRYGSSSFQDYTHQYRQIYPEPKYTHMEAIPKPTSANQQMDAVSDQKNISNLIPSSDQQQNATPTQKKPDNMPVTTDREQSATSPQRPNVVMPTSTGIQQENPETQKKEGNKAHSSTTQQEAQTPPQKIAVIPSLMSKQEQDITPPQKNRDASPASTIQQESNQPAGAQLVSTSPTTAQSLGPESWNIGNVVDMLSQVKKKRLSSAPESSPKRVRTNDNEVLDQVSHQATITKSALEKLQSIAEQHDAKLQEVSATAEQNKQTLSDMQSELRHFMSAVASTLRDIQERLEE
ncbi:hypothetical protein CFAM422_009169 [Trichoderma lentiforme]|uniref:Uncharacterized protein n=1 Tax=Trichoderma lentiforme TaxID=1567552 RepID=A0A9P4X9S7_9HYPO|nr:hypothetical protein CFAM422_009169 [Trichoderma lentiforme]